MEYGGDVIPVQYSDSVIFRNITSVIIMDLKWSKNDVIEVWIFSINGSGVRTVLYYINLLRFTAVFTQSQLDNWFPSSYMAIYGAVLCEMTVYLNVIWALLQKLTLPCCVFVPEMHEHTTVILHVYIVQFWHCECVCVCVFQEWKDGLASPEDLSPATLQSPSYTTDSLIGCTSLPHMQVCLHNTLQNFNTSKFYHCQIKISNSCWNVV